MAVSTICQEFVFETQRFDNISVSANSFTSLTLSGKTGYTLVSIYFILSGSNSGNGVFVKMNDGTTILVTNTTNNAVSGWRVDAKCLWRKS